MNMLNFNKHKAGYLAKRRKELDQLENIDIDHIHTIEFNLNQLNSESGKERLLAQLAPIKKLAQVLYYFEMSSTALNKKLLSKAKSTKKRKNPKLPQLNELHVESSILYVGKTAKSGFGNRIIQHLGYSTVKTTYALHLALWATNFDLNIKLNYAQPNLNGHEELLEEVESILHMGLMPLMGRSGH